MTDRGLMLFGILLLFGAVALWVRTRPGLLHRRGIWQEAARLLRMAEGPAVLAFTSPDCAPCRTAQRPALAEVAARTDGRVQVQEVDIVRSPGLARQFGVFSVPSSLVVDARGRVVAFNIGFASAAKLLAQIGSVEGGSV